MDPIMTAPSTLEELEARIMRARPRYERYGTPDQTSETRAPSFVEWADELEWFIRSTGAWAIHGSTLPFRV